MMHRWSRRRSRVGGVPDLLVATAPVNCVRIRTRGRTRPYSGGDRRTSGGVAMLAGRPGAGLTTLPEVVAHRQEQSQGGHEAEEYEGLHFRSSLPMAWRDLDRRDAEGGVRRVHSDARASCTPPGAKLVQGNFGQILGGSRPCAALASRGADEEPPEGLRELPLRPFRSVTPGGGAAGGPPAMCRANRVAHQHATPQQRGRNPVVEPLQAPGRFTGMQRRAPFVGGSTIVGEASKAPVPRTGARTGDFPGREAGTQARPWRHEHHRTTPTTAASEVRRVA